MDYHDRKATDRRDKAALLGRSDDDILAHMSLLGYTISWNDSITHMPSLLLIKRLWRPERKEIAKICIKGCVLSKISSVKVAVFYNDGQNVNVTFKKAPKHPKMSSI